MKLSTLRTITLAAIAGTMIAAANAGVNYNGWNYAIDAIGGAEDGSGGAAFFDKGLAFTVDVNNVYFALSSNMPLGGNPAGVLNGSQAHGELFINFSAHNLDTQAEFTDSQVFAVRFDANNDSLGNVAGSNPTTGVFNNVTAVDLSAANNGYASLQAYFNAGFGRAVDSMADLEDSNGDVPAYLSNGAMYPNISGGDRLGGITLLSEADLLLLGLDFSNFGAVGSSIYGFSFSRALLPTGDFTAHMFQECINDGMALKGTTVPEPGTIAAVCVGLVALARRRR